MKLEQFFPPRGSCRHTDTSWFMYFPSHSKQTRMLHHFLNYYIPQHHRTNQSLSISLYARVVRFEKLIDVWFLLFGFFFFVVLCLPHRKRDHRSSSRVCVCVCVYAWPPRRPTEENCIWLCESAREVRRRRRLMASPQLFMHWSGSSKQGPARAGSICSRSSMQKSNSDGISCIIRPSGGLAIWSDAAGPAAAANNTLHIYRWVESVCVIAAPYSCSTGRYVSASTSGYPPPPIERL